MELIRVSHRVPDVVDGQFCQLEQFRSLGHSIAEKELLWGFSDGFFEDASEICAVQPAEGSDIFDGNIVLEVLFDVVERLFYIEVSYPSACRHL